MTVISTQNNVITFINVWQVQPSNQQPLVELLVDMVEAVMKHQTGFVSASIHASADGNQIVVYAQWQSLEDWQKNLQNPEVTLRLEKMVQLGQQAPNMYKVVYESSESLI